MQVFDSLDPLIAGFIPILAALFFSWWMYYQLTNNGESHVWWKHILQSMKLAPKETAETAGLYDYSELIENSRSLFKWLGMITLALALWQTFVLVRRQNPYFLWGPRPVQFTGPDGRPPLPPKQAGAGGGGMTRPGGGAPPTAQPGVAPGAQPEAGQPGMQPGGMPGGSPQPGMAPGGPGMGGSMQDPGAGAPGPGGMMPGGPAPGGPPSGGPAAGAPGMVAPGMSGAPGTGGGGQFNPMQGR